MTEAWAPTTLCERLATSGLGVVEQAVQEMREAIANGEVHDAFEPLTLIGPAARGDLDAQRSMAMWGAVVIHDTIQAEVLIDQAMTLAESIMVARLAAAQGDSTDGFRLATLLALGAMLSWNPADRDEWAAECIARLELLADDGDERAAELLASLAGTETPEVLEAARAFRDRLLAVKEAV